jgi:ribosomal protein S18 acetylase RimI-like enzyme
VKIEYTEGKASEEAIYLHLNECNEDFIPPLEKKVDIREYSAKIFNKSVTFEAWDGDIMIGLVAAYFNDFKDMISYITNVSTVRKYRGKGISTNLLNKCIAHARKHHFEYIYLEVARLNHHAVIFYKNIGFQVHEEKDALLVMKYGLEIKGRL